MDTYKDGDKIEDWKKYYFCPVCGLEYEFADKSFERNCQCPAGHRWHNEKGFVKVDKGE